jgi:hypothetical protein
MFSVILLAMVVTTITQAATVVAVSQLHLDRPIAIGQAFASIRERIFELVLITIGVGMLIFLCVAVVAFAFVVPGLVLSLQWLSVLGMIVGTAVGGVAGVLLALRWSLVVPAAVLEHVGIRLAMARSVDLTTGQRGRIFVVYVLFVVLTMVFTSIWQVPVMVAVFTAGKAGPPLWTQIVTQVGSFVTGSVASPLMTIAIALMYYDARVRKEAFDLEHMLSQLDQPAGASELPA